MKSIESMHVASIRNSEVIYSKTEQTGSKTAMKGEAVSTLDISRTGKEEEILPQSVQQTRIVSTKVPTEVQDAEGKETDNTVVRDVSEQMEQTVRRMTEEDYAELEKEGDALEKYTASQLNRAIERVKKQRVFEQEQLNKQIDKKQEKREQIDDTVVKGTIKEKLEEANLPVTEENIAVLSTAMELVALSGEISSGVKSYFVESKSAITPEAMYRAKYSSSAERGTTVSDDVWKQLQQQVEELFLREGIVLSEEMLQNAKWLLSKEHAITKENLQVLTNLQDVQELEPKDILKIGIQAMQQGQDPRKMDLLQTKEEIGYIEQAVQTMEVLSQVKDEDIAHLKEGSSVTLETLLTIGKENPVTENKTKEITVSDLHQVQAKRQLEEIRVKLTMESAYQLHKQGIPVNTTELIDLVDELRALEQQYYHALYQEAGVEPTVEQVQQLQQTVDTVEALKGMPNRILGTTYENRHQITLSDLKEEGQVALSYGANKTSEYEKVMTVPRKDLGDSIQKAFENVEAILKQMGVENTESNQRAVRILAYNQMELTKENIAGMKQYDMQVNQLIQDMKPEVVVELIRGGIQPLEQPVEQLHEEVKKITQTLGETSEEKFSKYLYDLDQKKELTPQERESFIGIYRLLHQVTKSDGAAVGAVVKANQEVTLNTLLTAVRSKKKEGMDIALEKDMGTALDTSVGTMPIDEQIHQAYYQKELVGKAYDAVSVEGIQNLADGDMEKVMDLPVETLWEQLDQHQDIGEEYTALKYEKLLESYKKDYEASVLATHHMKVTAVNLEAANYLMSQNSTFYKDLEKETTNSKLLEQLVDGMGNEKEFSSLLVGLEESLEQRVEQAMEHSDCTYEETNSLNKLRAGIHLVGEMSRRNLYEVPVQIGEQLVTMKVQVLSGNENEAKIGLRMEEETWGTFEATMVVQDKQVSGLFLCDHRDLLSHVEAGREQIEQQINQLGLQLKQLHCSMNQPNKHFYRPQELVENKGTISTNTLYQVAKIVVASVRTYTGKEK